MGRVARFKKVKKFDPYSKQNRGRVALEKVGVWGMGDSGRKTKKRSLTAQKLRAQKLKRRGGAHKEGGGAFSAIDGGFDLPPDEVEDDFDEETMEVKHKHKPPTMEDGLDMTESSSQALAKAQRQAEREERRIDRLLRKDAEAATKPVVTERKEGENKSAFRKRIQAETRQIIRDTSQTYKNPEKKQKKKEFLNNKKLKKKGGVAGGGGAMSTSTSRFGDDAGENNYGSDDDGLVTAERAIAARALDTPKFGEQAERPPDLKLLPRGARKAAPSSSSSSSAAAAANKRKHSSMDQAQIQAEQEAMESMRRKVQAQYALVRKKRRGEFHL